MKQLANFFITNSKFTMVITISFIFFGIMGIKRMKSETYPNVSLAVATVTTYYRGASAEDIEIKITKPLEDEIKTVPGLKDVKSTSQIGMSKIIIRVDQDNPDVNTRLVMADIQKAIDRTTNLPSDLRIAPKFAEIKSEEMPVLQIAILGKNDKRQRDKIVDLLKEEFEDNKKIKSILLLGHTKRQFNINLSQDKLIEHHMAIEEVMAKVAFRNVNIPSGSLKDVKSQSLLKLEGQINNKKELENILIRSNFSGQGIYLKDIAQVVDGKDELRVKARYNGKDATLMTITKKGGTDTTVIINNLKQRLKNFKNKHRGFDFYIYLNEANKVQRKLNILSNNATTGLFLVIIFLFLFLPGRIGILASLSLPLSVLATLGLMPVLGVSLNAITIMALVIALGMLVDNSVVISENFTRLRLKGKSPKEAALESITTLWLPITATALTTIAAFLPMLVTKGMMGQFIKWIPIIVSISLVISLIESFFLLPMRLTYFSGKIISIEDKETKHKRDWFHTFELFFERFMTFCIKRRYLVILSFTVLLITSVFLIAKVNKFILFPSNQTEIYTARIEIKKGGLLEDTHKANKKLSSKIKEVLGDNAKHIVSMAGSSKIDNNDPKMKDGNNVGIIFIYVTQYAKNNLLTENILKKLRTIKVPGIEKISFQAIINGPPVGDPIDATFRSNDPKKLQEVIVNIRNNLSKVTGIIDLAINDVYGDDEIFIDIDYEKADQLGLAVKDIGNTIRTAISGTTASLVTLHNKEIDLVIRLKNTDRQNTKQLESLAVMDKRGNLVPIGSFATFRKNHGSPQIKRHDYKRAKTLTGNVNTQVITASQANRLLKKYYMDLVTTYPEVSLVFGGAEESTNESMESLTSAGILTVLGIFAILVFLFRSYLRPIIVMMTIPLGLLGISVTFLTPYLSGLAGASRPISFLALIGIVGLAGIIVNSGIVLLSFIDQLREEGQMSLHQILVKASGMRLRAVLVTSLTTISGLVPTAYGIGGSDDVLVPMTLSMAAGLTSGTILTLVFIPCAYAILEDLLTFMDKINPLKKKTKEI